MKANAEHPIQRQGYIRQVDSEGATRGAGIKPAANLLLLALLFTGCFSTLAYGWTDSWESIRQTASRIETITAGFVQEKHLPLLKKPLVSTGVLYYQKPDSLRWEYYQPVASILMSHKGEINRYLKQNGKFVKDASSRVQAMQLVLDEITLWLAGRFKEGQRFIPELQPGGKIMLRPAHQQMGELISHIVLQLSQQPGLIESVTIVESESSYTTLEFKQVKLNHAIDASMFQHP